MTALTDLPEEILASIFRQFLSRKLADHQYLCTWKLETDARRTRATLYSLSLVSKALSSIAFPLLYEQLFDPQDMQAIVRTFSAHSVTPYYMASVRYLNITEFLSPSRHIISPLQRCIAQCDELHHISLELKGPASGISAFLFQLAKLPGTCNLQSLSISLSTSAHEHTLFRNVCRFQRLAGLAISVTVPSASAPSRPLQRLKHLDLRCYDGLRGILRGMALSSPDSLQRLDLRHGWVASGSESAIFGTHVWQNLAHLGIQSDSLLMREISQRAKLPALRRLQVDLHSSTRGETLFSSLPSSVVVLEVKCLDVDDLMDILTQVREGPWTSGSIGELSLSLDDLFDRFLQFYCVHEMQPYSKGPLLKLAREAIQAAPSRRLQLFPEDMVDVLEKLEIWEYETVS